MDHMDMCWAACKLKVVCCIEMNWLRITKTLRRCKIWKWFWWDRNRIIISYLCRETKSAIRLS